MIYVTSWFLKSDTCNISQPAFFAGLAAQAHSQLTNIPGRSQAKISSTGGSAAAGNSKDSTSSGAAGSGSGGKQAQNSRGESGSSGSGGGGGSSIRESTAAALKEMVKTPIMREKNADNCSSMLKSRSDGSASNRMSGSVGGGSGGSGLLNSTAAMRHHGSSGTAVGGGAAANCSDPRVVVNRAVSLDASLLEGGGKKYPDI